MTQPQIKSKGARNWRWRQGSPSCCGAQGFTLVEVLIVLLILSVLAAVVITSITGAFARGAEQAYATDRDTIQSAVLLFYYDGHASDTNPPGDAWDSSADNLVFGHYYPASTGLSPDKTIDAILADANAIGSGYIFPTEAIWMGLLYNSPSATSTHDNYGAAPLINEMGPYLNEVPKSASRNNYATANGSYTWIIARAGVVYGAYWDGSDWDVGFSGSYP